MDLGRLVARLVIGGLFVGHGTQKLFGWFGGPGIEGTEQMTEALDLQPARPNALLVGATETAGGAFVALGAATPAAAAGLIGTMVTAARKVHLSNGFWAANGGYEFNVALIAALMALVDAGPGKLSFDAMTGRERKGSNWALASLATGAAASAAVIAIGQRKARPNDIDLRSPEAAAAANDEVAGDPAT
ncbi:MAG: DoxX family protein, partial [Acidimicrobiales bacterium]